MAGAGHSMRSGFRKERAFVRRLLFFAVLVLGVLGLAGGSAARDYRADSLKGIKEALPQLAPGDRLLIAPGEYPGGCWVSNLNGRPGAPVVLQGEVPGDPPVFVGANEGLRLKDCNHVVLRNLKVVGARQNGINIDDGGTKESPSTHISLQGVVVEDTGPYGNRDAIKMSGVQHFVLRGCRVSGWASSGVDMVGCARGLVTDCRFIGKEGFGQKNGIQIKGGSQGIVVEKSLFVNYGRRGINLGGHTGLAYFRPEARDFEARNVEIGGNIFLYGGTGVAFVTSQGGVVHHNAILYPGGPAFRILQETADPRFRPCGTGIIMRNIVVADSRMRRFVGVGPGTNALSFMFRENAWYDEHANRKPDLPVMEMGPVYGVDPGVVVKGGRVYFVSKDPRLRGKGPSTYKRQTGLR